MKKNITLILAIALILTLTGLAAREWTSRQTTAHQIAELARSMGLPEDDPIIMRAQEIWWEDEPQDVEDAVPYAEDNREQTVDLYSGVVPYEIAYDPDTDYLAVMLAKTMYNEARGMYSLTELSMICWTVLNRVDSGMYASVYDALMAPWQFAYGPYAPTVSDYGYDLTALARDVLYRWRLEHEGYTDVGRTLPSGYCWYAGDGVHNYFRNTYGGQGGLYFGLTSPYES